MPLSGRTQNWSITMPIMENRHRNGPISRYASPRGRPTSCLSVCGTIVAAAPACTCVSSGESTRWATFQVFAVEPKSIAEYRSQDFWPNRLICLAPVCGRIIPKWSVHKTAKGCVNIAKRRFLAYRFSSIMLPPHNNADGVHI